MCTLKGINYNITKSKNGGITALNREDRFTWKAGDVKVTLSQCSDCIFNKGIDVCVIYDVKPYEYALNKEKCPEYER